MCAWHSPIPKTKYMRNKGKICIETNCSSVAKIKGRCTICYNRNRREKGEVNMINKELKKLEKHLKKRPDEKLIKGYKEAMKDYKDTGNEQCKYAADIIKKEIDTRGLKIE